ncbi:MAG: hypothetical protein ACRD3W_19810, partial [Terriglobales bacterium]
AKPLAQDDKLTKSTLTMMSTMLGDSGKDMFNKVMADGVQQQYGDLTSLGSARHDGHLLNPLNWGRGIMDTDIDRLEHDYEKGRVKQQTAADSADLFLAHNGDLFKRIAGDRGVIDKETLQKALDADAKEKDPAHKRFQTDDERKAAKYMVDHWDDPEMNQLKNHELSFEDKAKIPFGSAVLEGTRTGAKAGYEWGGVIGGIAGGVGGFVADVTGIGGAAISYENHKERAGGITLDTLAAAAKANGIDPNHTHPDAYVPGPKVPQQGDQKPVVGQPPHAGDPVVQAPHVGDPKPGDQKPGDQKPGDQKPGDQKPGDQKPDPRCIVPAESDLPDDVIRKGDSYWTIAKRHLGKGEHTNVEIFREMKRLQDLNGNKKLYFNPNQQTRIQLEEEYPDD